MVFKQAVCSRNLIGSEETLWKFFFANCSLDFWPVFFFWQDFMGRQLLAMNVMWKYREQVTFAFHGTMCLVANCAMRQLSEYNKKVL